jgi:hypothetical protein
MWGCACCGQAGKRTVEHVVPQWFISRFFPGGTTYHLLVNGCDHSRRDGSQWAIDHFNRFLLDVCERCNGLLGTRFEQGSTKSAVEAFFDGRALLGDDPDLFGEWIVKTLILIGHPNTRRGHPPPDSSNQSDPLNARLVGWLPSGSPPDFLSCWVARSNRYAVGGANRERTTQLSLPSFQINHERHDAQIISFGLAGAGEQFFNFHLVYHPGVKLEHPLEGSGATRVWPAAGALALADIWPLTQDQVASWDSFWGPPYVALLDGSRNPLVQPWSTSEVATASARHRGQYLPGTLGRHEI